MRPTATNPSELLAMARDAVHRSATPEQPIFVGVGFDISEGTVLDLLRRQGFTNCGFVTYLDGRFADIWVAQEHREADQAA